MILASTISKEQLNLLAFLVADGPLIVDQSSETVDSLIKNGLLVEVCHKGNPGYLAATRIGQNVFCGCMGCIELKSALSKRAENLVREKDNVFTAETA